WWGRWRQLGDDCTNGIHLAVDLAKRIETLESTTNLNEVVQTRRIIKLEHIGYYLYCVIAFVVISYLAYLDWD
ncbi:MAG: hypothetical protein P1V97_33790, partial [Planctomycetota bacterium]|nr:hypothetical protein [Planctomycetota bacterium]